MTDWRDDLDERFVRARSAISDAFRAWRAYCEYMRIGPYPKTESSAPEPYQAIGRAKAAYQAISLEFSPPEPAELRRRLENREAQAIDEALEWLYQDPFCWRSGFLKQNLMAKLCTCELTPAQRDLAQTIVLNAIQRGRRAEFRETRRWARHLDSAAFRDDLRQLAETAPDDDTRWRARQVLGLCERNDLSA